MTDDIDLLKRLSDAFNTRDMEGALATMQPDVVWANGLEGGHVYGRDGVRDYWTRQWATIDSHVEPISFSRGPDGTIEVTVHLTARDHAGNVLFDRMGTHVFRIDQGLIRRFDIR
jgi:hypothetical protein